MSSPLAISIEKLYSKEEDALQKIRGKAWEQFQAMGLPTKDSEVYRYLRLRHFLAQSYGKADVPELSATPFIYPECQKSVLVFVNGHFSQELSDTSALPENVVVSSLTDAMRPFGTLLQNHWTRNLKEESDPFVLLNSALHTSGLFLYVPPKTRVEVPLQILHLVQTEGTLISPRVQLFMGAHTELQIVISTKVLSGKDFTINQVLDVTMEERSHLDITQTTLNEGLDVWHLQALRASMKRESVLHAVSVTNGCGTLRDDYRVTMHGENSEAILNGLWMLDGKREAHSHVVIDHQAPNCHSNQLFKGVLEDTSRSSFEGKILVQQAAQKTMAYQMNQNLLLSDNANANSKPNLEIFADDVKASHGSTTGQLDNELLFYMRARGLSEKEAKKLLVKGFCHEVLEKIRLPSLREQLL